MQGDRPAPLRRQEDLMRTFLVCVAAAAVGLSACGGKKEGEKRAPTAVKPAPVEPPAQPPPLDPTNIVSIAVASPDHKTLVAALKAADYVTAVANPGPLTVFAPTDAAFAKLPPGTVETLVKPENQATLKEILKYHATTAVYQAAQLTDGMSLAMANGAKVTIKVVGEDRFVNDAKILASVRASNGIVHVIDGVLTPPK
jgi:uncharacterized surface protein with fasciclin (FAS1) repeats